MMTDLHAGPTDIQWLTAHRRWFTLFLPLAWAGHVGLGMALTVFGPTQPYLAKGVGVNIDTINFLWTSRSIGFMLASFVTGFTFKRFLTRTFQKLMFIASAELLTGLFVILTPWMPTFPALVVLVLICGMFLGAFDTSDNSLMVYMFGPKLSRPFTQSVHAFVALGCVLGSFVVQPFLPQETEEEASQSVCGISHMEANSSEDVGLYQPEMMGGIPKIHWAYIVIGLFHFVVGAGNILLALSRIEMPCFVVEEHMAKSDSTQTFTVLRFWKSVLLMVWVYYILSCGLEGFFQAMTYTYGLCGPLKLTTNQASLLNTIYYIAFVSGRASGIPFSRILEPRTLIVLSISGCLSSAFILSFLGYQNIYGLYIGTALMGYAISFQFASGISWTAERFDVTGSLAFLFFVGGFTGFLSFPPMAGMVFTSTLGPIGIFYLSTICCGAHLVLFGAMNFVSKFKEPLQNPSD